MNSAAQYAKHLQTLYPPATIERALRLPSRKQRQAQARYYNDLVAWTHDCLDWPAGEEPTAYQDEMMAALVAGATHRICGRGPHGLGKTALAAWIVHWFALTRDGQIDWKAITTAGAWRQLAKFLWPEIHKWARRIRWDRVGRPPYDERRELQTLALKLRTGEAFAVASDNAALIEGAHANSLLFLFDESKAIGPATFDAAEGAFSGAGPDTGREAFAVAFSTPGEPNGRFADIQHRRPGYEDWWVRAVSLAEVVAAGRVSATWAAARQRQWGETSAVYQNRVLGAFASSEADGVIPLAWVEAANARWHDWQDAGGGRALTTLGVDPAWTGEDQTVLALRYGWAIGELRRYRYANPMETTGHIVGILRAAATDAPAIVDVIGLGAGIVPRLRELGWPTVAFNAAAGCPGRVDASGELGFANKRAAAWWLLRELLDPDNGIPVALPPDDELTGDLVAPKWWVVSGGRIQIESKKDLRARLGRSTDAGDAVVQAFWDEPDEETEEVDYLDVERVELGGWDPY